MDIEELDINAVCFGILCNFPHFCGEERAKEAAELVRALQAENEKLREQVRQLETRARTERCDAADYDCRELGALRREVSALRERLADPPEKKEG